uniref:GH09296p n=2 Tax=melanogaster subgroup TaxID=32351 RepID=Q8T0T2_DROME|eukprot:NP_001163625.1 globin 1, isoform E [Drosophila melanogaster]
MNSDEVQLIKKTWEIPVATPTDSGAAILTQFFNRFPSNLEKFPFRDVPLEELSVSCTLHIGLQLTQD